MLRRLLKSLLLTNLCKSKLNMSTKVLNPQNNSKSNTSKLLKSLQKSKRRSTLKMRVLRRRYRTSKWLRSILRNKKKSKLKSQSSRLRSPLKNRKRSM